eukprot:TRINITY_DN17058_c0_g1_i1.p1 TRINITY_DN17058_c0_g1~~TRINITY_DN17058_c0_g1_i1.p1  ORF type:complete len:53 (+),score=8.25 TRINITY_DN17058_c0_g1_i1:13-171(+)
MILSFLKHLSNIPKEREEIPMFFHLSSQNKPLERKLKISQIKTCRKTAYVHY